MGVGECNRNKLKLLCILAWAGPTGDTNIGSIALIIQQSKAVK